MSDVDQQRHCGAGLFFEVRLDNLKDITQLLTRKNQTIGSYGIKKTAWQDLIRSTRTQGIDRIVPIGQALEFSVIWDGIDLLKSFCREISITEVSWKFKPA